VVAAVVAALLLAHYFMVQVLVEVLYLAVAEQLQLKALTVMLATRMAVEVLAHLEITRLVQTPAALVQTA
jgi:hypothetical protein